MSPTKIHSNPIFLRGSFLVYGLFVVFFVSIILTGSLSFVANSTKVSLQTISRNEAFHVSEAGVLWYRWYLAHMVDGRTAQQIQAFWTGGTALGVGGAYTGVYEDSSGPVGHYSITVVPPATGSTIVTVTSQGWMDRDSTAIRTIKVRFRRPSWSEYSALANDEMRFGEGTEVYGRIHSNFGVRFDGVAHNIITSSVASYDDPDHCEGALHWDGSKWVCNFSRDEFGVHTHANAPSGSGVNDSYRSAEAPPSAVPARIDVFQAGRTFPVPTVDFNGVLADLNLMKGQACTYNSNTPPQCTVVNNCSAAGCYFDTTGVGRQIVLKANGTYDVYTVNSLDATTNNINDYMGTKNSDGTGSACTTGITTSGPNTMCKDTTSNPKCYCAKKNYKIPDNGIIFVEDNIWLDSNLISGTNFEKFDKSYQGATLMNGEAKVSIVAANISGGSAANMFLGGTPIQYARSDGSTILGIIGQKDIEIIKNSQDHLRIDGALLAQTGRVGRANYGSSDHRSDITVNGAIATNQRYGFAWTNGSLDWGYTTRNLIFDNNLLYYPPPFFPTGTQYLMDLWEEL